MVETLELMETTLNEKISKTSLKLLEETQTPLTVKMQSYFVVMGFKNIPLVYFIVKIHIFHPVLYKLARDGSHNSRRSTRVFSHWF